MNSLTSFKTCLYFSFLLLFALLTISFDFVKLNQIMNKRKAKTRTCNMYVMPTEILSKNDRCWCYTCSAKCMLIEVQIRSSMNVSSMNLMCLSTQFCVLKNWSDCFLIMLEILLQLFRESKHLHFIFQPHRFIHRISEE